MNITIKKEIFKKFNPKLKLIFIKIKNLDNQTKIKESKHLVNDVEKLVRLTFNKPTVKNHHLIAPWAAAQEMTGGKAKHYHTSVERLLKKILRRKTISVKDVLTNLVRFLAVKHIVPFAVDDLDKINGNVTYALSSGRKKVSALKTLKAGELYYHDNEKVLGMKLDYWKSAKSTLSPESTSALIHFGILPPITAKEQNELLKETQHLVQTFCGGNVEVFVLSNKNNSVKLSK